MSKHRHPRQHHRLFTEQIEVKQSVDVNITLVELLAAVHAVVQTEHISECEAALRLAEQLADVPELAAILRDFLRLDLSIRNLVREPLKRRVMLRA